MCGRKEGEEGLLNGDSRDDVESGGFYFNTNAMKGDSLMRHLFNFIFVRFPT